MQEPFTRLLEVLCAAENLNPHLQTQLSRYCQELCFSYVLLPTQLFMERARYVENVKYYQFKFLV